MLLGAALVTTTEVVDAESVAISEVGAALEADPGVLVNSDALASVEEVISEVGTGIDDKGVSVAAWAAKASETKARSLSGRIVRVVWQTDPNSDQSRWCC